jgi:hypothetical protein
MSGHAQRQALDDAAKANRKSAVEKCTRVYSAFNLMKATRQAEKGKKSSQETRSFPIDISGDMEKRLGGLRNDLASSCAAVGLTSPLPDRWQVVVDIDVTAAGAIWQAIDANRIWEAAQNAAFSACIDRNVNGTLDRIYKAGADYRSQLNVYAALATAWETAMPAEVTEQLTDDMTTFVSYANSAIENMTRRIELEAGAEAVAFVGKQLRLETDIMKYRAGKVAIVLIDSGVISGHIAHAAASFGATAPLAIIAIVRLVIEIGTIAVKAVVKMNTLAAFIETQIAAVAKYWSDEKNKKSVLNRLRVNTLETIAGALKGLTNLDVTSIEACKTLINDYQHKLNVLTATFNDLGGELMRLQNVMLAYAGVLNAFSARLTREQKATVNRVINGAESTYKAVWLAAFGTEGKEARIKIGTGNVTRWTGQLDEIEEVTSGFTKWVPKLVSIATSAGLGLGHIGGEHVETVKEAGEKTLKLIGEAITVLVADVALAPLCERLATITG